MPDGLDARPYLDRWALTDFSPFTSGQHNLVGACLQADGTKRVLKLFRDCEEGRSELRMLSAYAARGLSPQLLAVDEEGTAVLMEHVEPGTDLTTWYPDRDAEATQIVCERLSELWTVECVGRALESWCAAYGRFSGSAALPDAMFRAAHALLDDLLRTTTRPVPLHGDLHHENLLWSEGDGRWLTIDPKGLWGDRHFDICQYLLNPLQAHIPPATTAHRLKTFCECLNLEPRRARAWVFVHGVLNVLWAIEDGDPVDLDWARQAYDSWTGSDS